MAEANTQAVKAYMEINGLVWKLLEDGSLAPMLPEEVMDPS
ncbi:hypothetical protein [Alcanivorax sp. DP30]|nr:hypothetical protein [Alcanivorax sp. DP30]